MKIDTRKYIVFCEEHYNPLGIVRTLGENGIVPEIVILKSKYKFIEQSKYAKKVTTVASIPDGISYISKKYSNENTPPVLFTCDDIITGYLDEHYEEFKDRFIFYNAGSKGRLHEYVNKKNILDAANRVGLSTLQTILVEKGNMEHGIPYPVITKASDPLRYGWKDDMRICADSKELSEAYKTIRSEKVIIQHYIDKKNEYCLEGFSWNKGNEVFIAIACTYEYNIKGNYGQYMTVRNFDNDDIQTGLNCLFKEIGYEGIFEVEFLEDQDGKLYFSEINFRNSTWSYAATRAGMPLPVLWSKAMTGELEQGYYKKIPDHFMAMVEFNDFRYRVRGHMVSFRVWWRDYKNAQCKYYSGFKDIRPFIYSICYRGKNFILKKITGKERKLGE